MLSHNFVPDWPSYWAPCAPNSICNILQSLFFLFIYNIKWGPRFPLTFPTNWHTRTAPCEHPCFCTSQPSFFCSNFFFSKSNGMCTCNLFSLHCMEAFLGRQWALKLSNQTSLPFIY